MDEGSTSSEDEELVNVRSHKRKKRNMETKKKGKKKLATEISTEVMHHEVGYLRHMVKIIN